MEFLWLGVLTYIRQGKLGESRDTLNIFLNLTVDVKISTFVE